MPAKSVKITFWNFLTLEWLTPLLYKGIKKTLTDEDLYNLPEKNTSNHLSMLMHPFWEQFKAWKQNTAVTKPPALFNLLFRKYGLIFLAGVILQAASVACALSQPTFLQEILKFLSPYFPRDKLLIQDGVALSFILWGLQVAASVCEKVQMQLMAFIQVDMKTILIGAVYEKSLRLSQASSRKYTQGQILNLINVDIEKISMLFVQIAGLFTAPIQLVVSIILIGNLIGYAVWGGAGTLFGIMFLQISVIGFLVKFQKLFLAAGDRRIKSVREVLYGMKIIKFRALENFFYERISGIRTEQQGFLKKYYMIQVYFIGLIQIAPISMPITAFLIYGSHSTLTPQIIFPALSLFGGLFAPLMIIPQSLTSFIVARVSWLRLTEFLLCEEQSDLQDINSDGDKTKNGKIKVEAGNFVWEKVGKQEEVKNTDDKKTTNKKAAIAPKETKQELEKEKEPIKETVFELKDINLDIKIGSNVAIVGPVGSGKSSLLSAFIGEMPKSTGKIDLEGKIAYCSQQPWILTETIQGNIVFNQELNQTRLNEILTACGLDKDLQLFPSGIMTEIGEKGINLSGGQKARVAVARALYRNPDIVLLDDPLSALDAHVGSQLFNEAIIKYLKSKTVVVVTHQLHFLPDFDHIVVMKDGRIAEQGPYKELMGQNGLLTELMKSYSVDEKSTEKAAEVAVEVKEEKDIEKKQGLIVEEDKGQGSVSLKTYTGYFEKCGGTPYVMTFMIAGLCNSSTQVVTNLWLSWWSSYKYGYSSNTYMTVYGLLGLGNFIFALTINTVFVSGSYRATRYYHSKALESLFNAPMSFFDSQPIGRILNRLSKDIESVDQALWILLFMATVSVSGLLATTVFIIYIQPLMAALILPLLVIFYFMIIFYQRSNICFKRYESTNRSPLYAHVSETFAGISTVKAYRVEKEFIARQRALMNLSNKPTFLRLMSAIWMQIRLEFLTSFIALLLCLLGTTKASDPASIAVALTYAITFTRTLSLLLLSTSQLENEFNSVERLTVYCEQLPKEEASLKETDPLVDQWPTLGNIIANNISMCYPSRPDVMVLKNISFDIKAGEKIGVIGRTGSGKSTLMQALFRIVELKGGKIDIDGYNIRDLGLKTLRSRIQIIPQEPVLFSGTIRNNLDVESNYQDTDIWDALERIGLKTYVMSLEQKLDSPVTENGDNLSVGQRQLICLGRAILVKPKILVMDEATASVDADADKLIQESIKTFFSKTTVLCIAHRLNTIVDFDRVLVLEKGERMEYDTPHNLLSDKYSLFSKLADATGPTNSAMLRQIAKTVHESKSN